MHHLAGQLQVLAGRWEEGAVQLEAAAAGFAAGGGPELAEAHTLLATCLEKLDRVDEAVAAAELGVSEQRDGNDAEGHTSSLLTLAQVLDAAGEHDRADEVAIAAFTRAREGLGPTSPLFVNALTLHALRRGRRGHPARVATISQAIAAIEAASPWDAPTTGARLAKLRQMCGQEVG